MENLKKKAIIYIAKSEQSIENIEYFTKAPIVFVTAFSSDVKKIVIKIIFRHNSVMNNDNFFHLGPKIDTMKNELIIITLLLILSNKNSAKDNLISANF